MVMAPLRFVRRDALPEDSHYDDEGCDLHPYCLTCPFPRCRYEYRQGVLSMRQEVRIARAVDLRALGYTVEAIASVMEVSKRAVYRLFAASRRLRGDTMLLKVRSNSGIVVLMGEPSYGTA